MNADQSISDLLRGIGRDIREALTDIEDGKPADAIGPLRAALRDLDLLGGDAS